MHPTGSVPDASTCLNPLCRRRFRPDQEVRILEGTAAHFCDWDCLRQWWRITQLAVDEQGHPGIHEGAVDGHPIGRAKP